MIALLVALPQASSGAGAGPQSSASAQWTLWGDYALADPWFLLLAVPALALLAHGIGRRAHATAGANLPGPGPGPGAPAAPRSLRQRLLWLAPAAKGAALLLAIVALARPLLGNVEQDLRSEGIDIALALDRSGSMRFEDLEGGRSRLEVVKEVVGDFARRRMTDRVNSADSCGLIAFARYPELVCPSTLDADALLGFLDSLELVRHEDEDGTAIGAGLAKAVSFLRESDARSRVVVLLTDGENNVDDISPMEAARLAASEGIRVYTVMAGRYVYRQDFFGRIEATEQELDTTELLAIAEQTGGRFFRARDRAALEQVYAEIEALERTPRHERRWVETWDLYPWLLAPALALYLFAWLSASTWARSAP